MTRRFVIENLPGVALVDQLAAVWAVVEMVSLVGLRLIDKGVFRFGVT